MQALTSSVRLAATGKVQTRQQRQAVVCSAVPQEQTQRRAVLAAGLAAVLGLAAGSAEAAQPAPKNSYIATSEGYNMEASGTPGTKKQGISPKRKAKILAKVRAAAGKQ
ncbi:hypothetical protein ABPG77_000273 [Micractinium sp. CCAP 211/92]